MAGKQITQQQVNLYMKLRKEGLSQVGSAVKTGMSERSGRRLEHNQLHPKKGKQRKGRTRKDPLTKVWTSELQPLLTAQPLLTPMTLLEHLQSIHPGQYPDSVLRTLQRRVKQWKAVHGPEKEVFFAQKHLPGQQGLSDFTKLKGVEITIMGKPFNHLLYHFRLAFSGWSYMRAINGGESYTALTASLQEALWRLGGVPQEHRTDHLSAAFKNHGKESKVHKKGLTERYEAFCQHYHMKPTHNNLGVAHENGSVEGPHGHLQRRIEQALLLRGSRDFKTVEGYQIFIEGVVCQHNRRNAPAVDTERKQLQSLPHHKTTDFDEVAVKVSSMGTIQVRRVTYSLPPRLVGERLRVHVYDDRLICYLGSLVVFKSPRKYPKTKNHRARVINYRHLIGSLKKKPQAFRYCQFREDLLPNDDYQQIWCFVDAMLDARDACKYIIGLLTLAADFACEAELGEYLMDQLSLPEGTVLPTLVALRKRYGHDKEKESIRVEVKQHELKGYDELLMPKFTVMQEVYYA